MLGILLAVCTVVFIDALKACDPYDCYVMGDSSGPGYYFCDSFGSLENAQIAYNENMEMYRLLKKRGFKFIPFKNPQIYLDEAKRIQRCCLNKPKVL